ncbi:ORF6N domain-containing protein [Parabacteroides sp.]
MNLQVIQNKIYEIREQQVILDFDLAELYNIETKVLKQAVRRNIKRFEGDDFMFEITKEELSRSQFVTLNKGRGKNFKYMPFAFTELGVAMLSSVLNNNIAIEINRNIMRAFVQMRKHLVAICDQLPSNKKLTELEQQVKYLQEDIESLSKDHENYEQHFDDIYLALAELAAKNKEKPANPRPKIGYVK